MSADVSSEVYLVELLLAEQADFKFAALIMCIHIQIESWLSLFKKYTLP